MAPRQRHWAPSSLSGVDGVASLSIQLDSEANRVNRGEVTTGGPSQQRRAMPVPSLTGSEAMAPTRTTSIETGAHSKLLPSAPAAQCRGLERSALLVASYNPE